MTFTPADIIGIIGAVFVLAGFFLVSQNKLQGKSKAFNGINLIGSVLLTINAFLVHAPAFMLLNGIWAIVALVALVSKSRVH